MLTAVMATICLGGWGFSGNATCHQLCCPCDGALLVRLEYMYYLHSKIDSLDSINRMHDIDTEVIFVG